MQARAAIKNNQIQNVEVRHPKSPIRILKSKIANLKSVTCTAAQSAVNDEDANRV
jgi:hypothetical protein